MIAETTAVTNGYQQTEVGLIPDDWSLVSLGRLISSVEYGSSAKSDPKGKIPVLRMGNLQDGKIVWDDLVYTDDDAEIRKYRLRSGDVLFNRTNTIDLVGKTAIYKGKRAAVFAGYLIRINVDESALDSRFLNYILNTEFARRHSAKVLSVAVGQANINAQKLKTYPIPVPPTLAEQEAIAEALGDADALIESLEQLDANKPHHKQAAMQQLLTGKKRLPGFDREWAEKRLGDIADFFSGGTPSTAIAEYFNGDIPWITSSDLNRRYIEEVEGRISQSGFDNSASKMVKANTLLMALYGATAGVTGMARIRAAINQAVVAIVPYRDSSLFLFFKLAHLKDWLIETYTQGGQPNLSGEIVKSLTIPMPEIDEQTAIAEVLLDMDAEIEALEAKLVKARQIKQGMMQELLTGRIRLV